MTIPLRSCLKILLAGCVISSCTDHDFPSENYPDKAEASNAALLAEVSGVKVYNGGFGSAIVQDPNDRMAFYLLTDRGPNIDGTVANSKVFASPGFVPQIGKFRLIGDQLVLEKTIKLKNENGVDLTGLPNPAGFGFSGETALDMMGNILPNSVDGLDSEGLAMAQDGTFWVSDEYGPHLVHFDAMGNTIERINPFGNGKGGRTIPLVFAKRRPNRGMEGLAITPDGKTLVGIMQFPLYNPSSAAIAGSLVTRILAYDIASGKSKEYVYLIEKANLQANSEIAAISNTTFLVLERDGEYATNANKSTVVKKVYKIDIAGATDISDPANTASGKLYAGLTVEQLKDAATLSTNGIVPVKKMLVADLMTDIPSLYPHDKAEGIAIINSTTIAIANDDDFGVVGLGTYAPKILPSTGAVDRNTIYFVKLKQPLW
ncbi:esterase-like activity of phytase family protein [Dyadobacter arcticus]|uniref:Phytase-like domain-containing protein n=1 Tax=Dyadobacter arcticus TaxID=1078754 RepID=A0ABX0UQX5_9BACT|nr:esterase-like activity of phytase family protein [Dyadobacter arcticus]NIJ54524.1 hypothetical protein [Dyadobacter arcticus]